MTGEVVWRGARRPEEVDQPGGVGGGGAAFAADRNDYSGADWDFRSAPLCGCQAKGVAMRRSTPGRCRRSVRSCEAWPAR